MPYTHVCTHVYTQAAWAALRAAPFDAVTAGALAAAKDDIRRDIRGTGLGVVVRRSNAYSDMCSGVCSVMHSSTEEFAVSGYVQWVCGTG